MTIGPRRQYILPATLISVLAILIFTGVGNAQNARSETGTVRGAVATAGPDGQSYNIPGASLKLKRGMQVAETSANDAGEYEFIKLSPGEYTLEATAGGFKTSTKAITIRTGEILVENVSLEVADVTASVTVASAVENVQTTEAAPASTVKQNTPQTLFAGFLLPVSAQSQELESLIVTAKGHGIISSVVDEQKITTALVVLRQNGTALITVTADLLLQAEGTWKATASSPEEILLKITGGVLKGEMSGSGKLLLTSDRKSIKELTINVTSSDGQKISVTFVADDPEAR